MMGDSVGCIARGEQRLDVGSELRQLLRQLPPAEPRHHDVGQQQVDRTVMLGREPQRRLAVRRL